MAIALVLQSPLSSSSSSSSLLSSRISSSATIVTASPISRLHMKLKPIALSLKSCYGFNVVTNKKVGMIVKASFIAEGLESGELESETDDEVYNFPFDKLPLDSKLQLKLERKMKMKISKKIRLRGKKLVHKRRMNKKGRSPRSILNKLKNI